MSIDEKQQRIRDEIMRELQPLGPRLTAAELARRVTSATNDFSLDNALMALTSQDQIAREEAAGMVCYFIEPCRDFDAGCAAETTEPTSPVSPEPEARFALWNDGALTIDTGSIDIHLSALDRLRLLNYLMHSNPNSVRRFIDHNKEVTA